MSAEPPGGTGPDDGTEPFERIVARHGEVVLRVCRAMLDGPDAEDAWSETFLSALRAYPDLRPGSDVGAWLVTIAHRRSIDQLRRRARRPVPVALVGDVSGEMPARATPAPVVPLVADDPLVAALRALPPRQRDAVVMRYLGDMAYDDIAAVVGATSAAVRRAAADGIAALRRRHRLDGRAVAGRGGAAGDRGAAGREGVDEEVGR